ncbi:unnamed protein product [Phyllotreta striolata]|uniref:Peptidase S1 domain-containing protein n=1 Tax=Phyllotreta striolata TaxID=444603 RepID=A0A9N9XQW8_PHYSR|nr:unnamed protein product [Phyllotreta striolata]
MYRWICIVAFLTSRAAAQNLESPCPGLLAYEPRKPSEPDRIFGVLTLLSEQELDGVWLRLIFDKRCIQLGNWFGQVKTDDNKVYRIQNRNKRLQANVPITVRFFIRFNANEEPPKLVEWRLNSKTVCKLVETVPLSLTTEAYYTSPDLIGGAQPVTQNGPQIAVLQSNNGNGDTYPPFGENNEDYDFFMGDFALLGKPQEDAENLQCGVVAKSAQPLITTGQPTREAEFPWHASIYHARITGIDLTYICGGSLISLNHIVTAAHCVTRRKSQKVLNPNSLFAYLGKFYLQAWLNPNIQDRKIEKIIVHEQYNSRTFSHDIAILKLRNPADLTDYVRPVCLWQENVNLESVISKQGTIVGWGYDHTGTVTEQLIKAYMPVVSNEMCVYSLPDFYSRFTSDYTYCAGFNNGTGACNGDSGGGMVFPIAGTDRNNPVWQLRGLVSISVALQNLNRCDSTHYVVFTDVAKYLDWIKKAIQM